jgi:hypothetical protein
MSYYWEYYVGVNETEAEVVSRATISLIKESSKNSRIDLNVRAIVTILKSMLHLNTET